MSTQTVTVDVAGMTCGHCVRSVDRGAHAPSPASPTSQVDLVTGATSHGHHHRRPSPSPTTPSRPPSTRPATPSRRRARSSEPSAARPHPHGAPRDVTA